MKDTEKYISEELLSVEISENEVKEDIFKYSKNTDYIVTSNLDTIRYVFTQTFDFDINDLMIMKDTIVIKNLDTNQIEYAYINIADNWYKI